MNFGGKMFSFNVFNCEKYNPSFLPTWTKTKYLFVNQFSARNFTCLPVWTLSRQKWEMNKIQNWKFVKNEYWMLPEYKIVTDPNINNFVKNENWMLLDAKNVTEASIQLHAIFEEQMIMLTKIEIFPSCGKCLQKSNIFP